MGLSRADRSGNEIVRSLTAGLRLGKWTEGIGVIADWDHLQFLSTTTQGESVLQQRTRQDLRFDGRRW